MPQRRFSIFFIAILILASFNKSFAQGLGESERDAIQDSIENEKPAKFQDFKLGSEKAEDKKFTRYRHFVQNSITHYNYYFNSNERLNAIVERAISSQKDDYNKLLSFYPYSLENTASQKRDLDSIIIRCTAGILIHDLRNDWIDNLYLLMGEAYFYKKDFDSAGAFF